MLLAPTEICPGGEFSKSADIPELVKLAAKPLRDRARQGSLRQGSSATPRQADGRRRLNAGGVAVFLAETHNERPSSRRLA